MYNDPARVRTNKITVCLDRVLLRELMAVEDEPIGADPVTPRARS